MARPLKSGLDYFPHDVGMISDRKFRPMRKKYGYLAPMVYMIILELIYGDKGYYLDYSEPESVLLDIEDRLSGRYQPDEETLESLIRDLVAHRLLSPDHFDRQIITSKRIQMCYYKATVDRKEVSVDPDIWMLTTEEMLKHSARHPLIKSMGISVPDVVIQPNNEVNRPNNEVNRPRSTQSKGKERKVKESKAEESKATGEAGAFAPAAADDFETILALIRDNICPVTSLVRSDIAEWMRHMDPACIVYAIQEAARSGAKTTKYVYTILQRMLDDGITTADRINQQPHRHSGANKMDFEQNDNPYAHYFDDDDLGGA